MSRSSRRRKKKKPASQPEQVHVPSPPEHVARMLEKILPGKGDEFRERVLWCCSAFPTLGVGYRATRQYRYQIEECLRERPKDPVGWAAEKKQQILDGVARKE